MADAMPPPALAQQPPAPSNPPTNQDIIAAHEYVTQARLVMYDGMRASNDDNYGKAEYAEAIRYEARVLASTEGGPPPWFAAALEPLVADIRSIKTRLANLSRTYAIDSNSTKGHGPYTTLQVVPFPDGSWPSEHGLPALDTTVAVQNLTEKHRDTYLQHYYNTAPRGTVQERKKLLWNALGCHFIFHE